MAQPDFTDPQHRIDNMAGHRFVKAWARLRHHMFSDDENTQDVFWYRGYMDGMEQQIAEELQLPLTTMVGRLVDIGNELCTSTEGEDEGGSATG